MNRKEDAGWPRSVTTEEDTNLIEELICSQEDAPCTHIAPREVNDGCHHRRYAHAIALTEKFECITHMIEKTVWQDEKDLPLTFLLTYNMTWYMEKENNLIIQMRTCLHPQIRCQEKLWFPLQSLDMAPQSCFLWMKMVLK